MNEGSWENVRGNHYLSADNRIRLSVAISGSAFAAASASLHHLPATLVDTFCWEVLHPLDHIEDEVHIEPSATRTVGSSPYRFTFPVGS